jgi:glycosyltransferase involved in cell wall biosynthesis
MKKISLIITTYNRPQALGLVLLGLAAQKCFDFNDFEVIVADDGSTDSTQELLQRLQPYLPYSLKMIWQPDQGFRAARARNLAVQASQGTYLIFLDGDCIPQTDFVANHYQLAENGWLVAGNRILLSQRFTTALIKQFSLLNFPSDNIDSSELLKQRHLIKKIAIWHWQPWQWLLPYLHHDINRFLPLLRLPDRIFPRKRWRQKWQSAKSCNLAIWRQDFLQVNGFNEKFQGWGHEDAELVVRLFHHGVQRKEGRFAVPVFHLWHQEQDRTREAINYQHLQHELNT